MRRITVPTVQAGDSIGGGPGGPEIPARVGARDRGGGGAVISGGRPFRGRNGVGAELGHVVIVHGGRPCQGACTGHGHLEAYVSGSAAAAAARETFGPSADAHRLVVAVPGARALAR